MGVGEDEDDTEGIDGDCDDGTCDGVTVDNAYCTATVSGPVDNKGNTDARLILIEADALPGTEMCKTKIYLSTVLISKAKGIHPAVYAPENCHEAKNFDTTDLVLPIPMNPGPTVIDDEGVDQGMVLSGPHDPIVLQVLGGCS